MYFQSRTHSLPFLHAPLVMIANTVLCAIPRIDISFIVLEHSERLLTDFWARRCDRQVAIDKCGRSFEPSTNLVLGAQAKEIGDLPSHSWVLVVA